MDPVLNQSQADHGDQETAPPLNVVILYEDVDTGKSAKEITDLLVNDLEDECELRRNLWRFDVLTMDPIREWAAHEAAQAEMVVIAAHGDRPLAPQLEEWTETWLSQRGSRHGALVGLLDREQSQSSNAQWRYLREVARRGNMDFFGHSLCDRQETRPEKEEEGMDEESINRASEYRHWGINE